MAFWQNRVLEPLTTLSSDAGTYSKKLPKRGGLSLLQLRLQWTNGATGGRAVTMLDVIDKIEIIANGSFVVFSLNSVEIPLWHSYLYGKMPYLGIDEQASAVQEWIVNIPFGLKSFHPQQFLALDAFSDLELRVTYSPTIAADGGFTTLTGKITVNAIISDELSASGASGYLRYTTIKSLVTAASGIDYTELVGDWPVLGIGVYAHKAGTALDALLSTIEVKTNDSAKTIFSDNIALAGKQHMQLFEIDPAFAGVAFIQDNDVLSWLSDSIGIPQLNPLMSAITIGTTIIPHFLFDVLSTNQGTLTAFSDEESATHAAQIPYATDRAVSWNVNYSHPFRGLVIPFGIGGDLSNALQMAGQNRVKVELTQQAAAGQVYLSTLELAPHTTQ